jgi:hypothetical protein
MNAVPVVSLHILIVSFTTMPLELMHLVNNQFYNSPDNEFALYCSICGLGDLIPYSAKATIALHKILTIPP